MTTQTNSNETLRLKRLDEASQWVQRMQDPRRDEEHVSEWLRWIDAHPDNFAEFERLQKDWQEYNVLKTDISLHRSLRMKRGGQSPTRQVRWAIAAGLGAVALGVGIFHGYLPWRAEGPEATRQVIAALTNRSATLPDGSKMILGAQSRVNMDFNGPRRELNLSAGEAYFKVKHDKARPFIVQAGDISVTAIGTSFDVRRGVDKITITVEEGIVEVSAPSLGRGGGGLGSEPAVWRAEAGYQVTYSTRDRTASIASINPAVELAWRSGELAYVREPLGSVVEDLNRHSRMRILIEDPEVADLPFTGTAFAASLEDWLAGIELAYPVTVRRIDGGVVVLSSGK